jgi:hypothetical protein
MAVMSALNIGHTMHTERLQVPVFVEVGVDCRAIMRLEELLVEEMKIQ